MIQDKALLVALQISMWSGRKYDKEVSKEVDRLHRSDNAGRFNKLLIDPVYMSALTTLCGEIRTYHYENTLPWLDNGTRMLPSSLYFDYCKDMDRFKIGFEMAVDDFIKNYDYAVMKAQETLGDLYHSSDYPVSLAMRDKFSIETTFLPIPSEQDFRVDIVDSELDNIREQLKVNTDKLTNKAVLYVWSKLKDVVSNMHNKLADEDAIFRNSLIGNIQDLVKALPALNITNDQELAKIADEVSLLVSTITPDDIRKDKNNRKEVVIASKEILTKMDAYMNLAPTR